MRPPLRPGRGARLRSAPGRCPPGSAAPPPALRWMSHGAHVRLRGPGPRGPASARIPDASSDRSPVRAAAPGRPPPGVPSGWSAWSRSARDSNGWPLRRRASASLAINSARAAGCADGTSASACSSSSTYSSSAPAEASAAAASQSSPTRCPERHQQQQPQRRAQPAASCQRGARSYGPRGVDQHRHSVLVSRGGRPLDMKGRLRRRCLGGRQRCGRACVGAEPPCRGSWS